MITYDQYSKLQFGDEVEIACSKRNILDGVCYSDESNAQFSWFNVAGIDLGTLGVLVPKDSAFNHWPWSDRTLERMGNPKFDRSKYGGYWVSVHPIRAFRSTRVDIDAPQSKETLPIPCFECKQFYPYAEPNYGKQLVCWSCRDSLGWKYGKDTTGQVFLKK